MCVAKLTRLASSYRHIRNLVATVLERTFCPAMSDDEHTSSPQPTPDDQKESTQVTNASATTSPSLVNMPELGFGDCGMDSSESDANPNMVGVILLGFDL